MPTVPRSCALLLSAAGLVSCAAFAAHPLATEDTGTQGRGALEVEVGLQRLRLPATRVDELGVQLSYGLVDDLDLIVRPTYLQVRADADGTPSRTRGVGDASVGFKWRFAETDAASLGTRVDVLVPTGDADRAIGAGGPSYRVLLIASREQGEWAWHGNVGYVRVPSGPEIRQNLGYASAAAVWSPWEQMQLSLELIGNSNPAADASRPIVSARGGFMVNVTDRFKLDVGYDRRINGGYRTSTTLLGATVRF